MGLSLAWPDIQAQTFGDAAIRAIIVSGVLFLIMVPIFWAISFLLGNFVVPTMYIRREPVLQAWGTAWRELIIGHGGKVFVFFLMQLSCGLRLPSCQQWSHAPHAALPPFRI
jgi:hypothetical protein